MLSFSSFGIERNSSFDFCTVLRSRSQQGRLLSLQGMKNTPQCKVSSSSSLRNKKNCRNRPSRVHVLKTTFVLSANSSCHWETFFLLPYLNSFHLWKPLSDFEIADLFNFHFSPPSLAPPVDIMFRFLHR